MDRRTFLATFGVVTAGSVSGCMEGPVVGEANPSPEATSRREPTTTRRTGAPNGTDRRGSGSGTGTEGTAETDGEDSGTDASEEAAGSDAEDDPETETGDRTDSRYPNPLRFVHTGGRRVFYEVAVSGAFAHTWGASAENPGGHQDAIHHDRRRLSGSVVGGEDAFAFQGKLVTLAIDGPATAFVGGDRVRSDVSDLGTALSERRSRATSAEASASTTTTSSRATTLSTTVPSSDATAAGPTGIAVREHRYRERPAGLDIVSLTLENGTEDPIERAAAYVAFYDRDLGYRFGTNAYAGSALAPGAAYTPTPERPFGGVSVDEYRVFLASTRHDAWVPATERTSL